MKRISIFAIILFFLVGFISCKTTTVDYAIPAEDAGNIVASGNISINSYPSLKEDDIVLEGEQKIWLTASEFLMEFFLSNQDAEGKQWQGTVSYGGNKKNIKVRYYHIVDFQTRAVESITFTDKHEGFDGFQFSVFHIDDGVSGSIKAASMKEMPYSFADFTFEGKKFLIQFTNIDVVYSFEKELTSGMLAQRIHDMMVDKNQVFQIVDDEGLLYAQFSGKSYKIFDASPNFDETKLIPAIACICIVQERCMNEFPKS